MVFDPPTPTAHRPSALDREAVLGRLQAGCAEERLSVDTFAARVERAQTAQSLAQLDDLIVDLPRDRTFTRTVTKAVDQLSRWTVRLENAWSGPRATQLALPLRESSTLGRSRRCNCVLADPTVSRVHARLRHGNGRWWLRDLQSANGTHVNGRRILDEVEVRPGDFVSFGAATFRLASAR